MWKRSEFFWSILTLTVLMALAISVAFCSEATAANLIKGDATGFNGTDITDVAAADQVTYALECKGVEIHNPDAQLDLTIEYVNGPTVTYDLDARSEPYLFWGQVKDISTTKSATQEVVYLFRF